MDEHEKAISHHFKSVYMCNIFNKLCIIIENDWTFRCKLTRPVGNVDHQGLRTAPCVPSPLLLPVPRFSSLTWMWISSRASVAYHARRPGARRGVSKVCKRRIVLAMASHIVRPSDVVKGARENLGHVVPADQDFPMQAV